MNNDPTIHQQYSLSNNNSNHDNPHGPLHSNQNDIHIHCHSPGTQNNCLFEAEERLSDHDVEGNKNESASNDNGNDFITSPKFIRYRKQIQKIALRIVEGKRGATGGLLSYINFDSFILFCILLNSISMACTDYTHIDSNYIPITSYEISKQNYFIEKAEIFFYVVFLVEFLVKATAHGFSILPFSITYKRKAVTETDETQKMKNNNNKSTYLWRDNWNKLDFLILLLSTFSLLTPILLKDSQSVNISGIRTIRILRPLRSLSKLPGLRKIIGALINSLEDLSNVIFLLTFFLFCFSVMGIQFWKGKLHFRCRLTPFPIHRIPSSFHLPNNQSSILSSDIDGFPDMDTYLFHVIQDPDSYRCLADIPNDSPLWKTQSSSPWFQHGPQDCFWPVDMNDEQICSLQSQHSTCKESQIAFSSSSGKLLQYVSDDDKSNEDIEILQVSRTCGSNYDQFGNPRFTASADVQSNGVYIEALNWGYTNFDDFFSAFVTTFQIISMEGWTDIMYQIMDSWYTIPTVILFVGFILFGGHIVLNLVLAVITSSLDHMTTIESETEKDEISHDEHDLDPQQPMNRGECHQNEEEPIVSNENNVVDERDNNVEVKSSSAQITRAMYTYRKFIQGPIFSNFIMICIIINTFVLGMDHYGISQQMQYILEILNSILTFIFVAEMVLLILAIGFKEYFRSPMLCFDGIIVAISILETILASIQGGNESGVFSVFRALRIFRIFKLAKSWTSLNKLLSVMYITVLEIGNFAFLLFIFIFIYALIGMQFFANRFHFDPENLGTVISFGDPRYDNQRQDYVPRSNFDGLFWSMTTVFQILSGENWNTIMYDARRATTSDWAVVYFISLVVLGSFIVMNLFLAILMKNFEGDEDNVEEDGDIIGNGGNEKKEKTWYQKLFKRVYDRIYRMIDQNSDNSNQDSVSSKLLPYQSKALEIVDIPKFDLIISGLIVWSSVCLALDNPLSDPNTLIVRILSVLNIFFTIVFALEMLIKVFAYNGLISYLRRDSWNVLDFFVVFASIFELVSESIGGSSQQSQGQSIIRVIRTFRVLRPLRMISRFPELKVVVDALLMSLPSVLNVGVICFLFFLIFAIFGVNFLKGSFYHCAGDIFDSLSPQLQEIVTDPLPLEQIRIIGSSTARLSSCVTYYSESDISYVPTSKEMCNCIAPGEWVEVIPQNFNNVMNAMALLFEISSTEGWVDVMYAAVDQRGIDAQPIRDSNTVWVLFFVFFLIIGAFFVLELFVGVVLDNFSKIRDEKGRVLMTEAQKEWATTQAFVMKIKPWKKYRRPPPLSNSDTLITRITRWCYNFIMPDTNPYFERVITGCIIVGSLCSSFDTFGEHETKSRILEVISLTLTAIFTLEAIIKIIALRSQKQNKLSYFTDSWNIFDFSIVVGTITALILKTFFPHLSFLMSVIQLMRIARLLRLVKSVKKLRILFNTLFASIPSIGNIGSLLFLLFFVYAVCGVQLYSSIFYISGNKDKANFRSFWSSMLLLMRFSTGENWNGFMREMIENEKTCDKNQVMIYDPDSPWCDGLSTEFNGDCTELNGCGGTISMYFYFYSFTLIVSFVVFNLFVAVVLEAFDNHKEGEILSPSDLEEFTSVWADFDQEATWYMNTSDLKKFVRALNPPLGFKTAYDSDIIGEEDQHRREDYNENDEVDRYLYDIPVNDEGLVNIVHVATHLAKLLAKKKLGDDFNELSDDHPIQRQILDQYGSMTRRTVKDVVTNHQVKFKAVNAFKRIVSLGSANSVKTESVDLIPVDNKGVTAEQVL